MATEEELKAARLGHARELEALGVRSFPNDFRASDEMEARRREFVEIANDEARRATLPSEDEVSASVAIAHAYGRVVAKRGPFLVLRTPYGDVQALVRPENLPEHDAAQYALVDLADHVAVEGPAMRTRTGAAAIRATRYRHLGKALLPPPAKWHGLKDIEKRYRERYVDLFANPEVMRVFRARSRILQDLRRFLDDRGFLEVETPILHPLRGGATARPFTTHHNALDLPLYLRIAPELYLKRLIVGGFDRVYELGRTFRNEGVSTRHNPEFTILEAYQAYATYEDLMDLTEAMFRSADAVVRAEFPDLVGERTSDLASTWLRVPMRKAIAERLERAGKDGVAPTPWSEVLAPDAVFDPDAVERICQRMIDRVDPATRKTLTRSTTYGERIYALYELLAEPSLVEMYRTPDARLALPVFITEYPADVSPLARRNDADPTWVDRFELFIDGGERANAFSELNDPDDQAERFGKQLESRERGDEEAMDYDADYIRALLHGMPPTAGLGIGVDRLVMLLCNQASIRDVLLFPLQRPERS